MCCEHYVRLPRTPGLTAVTLSSCTLHRVLAQTTWLVTRAAVCVLALLCHHDTTESKSFGTRWCHHEHAEKGKSYGVSDGTIAQGVAEFL